MRIARNVRELQLECMRRNNKRVFDGTPSGRTSSDSNHDPKRLSAGHASTPLQDHPVERTPSTWGVTKALVYPIDSTTHWPELHSCARCRRGYSTSRVYPGPVNGPPDDITFRDCSCLRRRVLLSEAHHNGLSRSSAVSATRIMTAACQCP